MSQPILICEDDPDLSGLLRLAFERAGFAPVMAVTGPEALEAVARWPFLCAVVLDIGLPGISGLDVCRSIRRDTATADLPVVLVTALGEEVDRVVGFEVGADDYVVKPFSIRELVLRVRALLRRMRPSERVGDELVDGSLRVDQATHRAWVDRRELELTPMEFRLLVAFLRHRGRALSREAVLANTRGGGHQLTSRAVDTHVKRLRAKLGSAGVQLQTLRGVGYRWTSAPHR